MLIATDQELLDEEDMSLLYSSSSYKYRDGEFRKNQEFVELNRHNSGLMRYRSAPSSFLESLVDGSSSNNNNTIEGEDFRYYRSSSPEMDAMLARFMSSCNGSANSNSHSLQDYEERTAIKQEMDEKSHLQMDYNNNDDMANYGNSSVNVSDSMRGPKINTLNASNLLRQNSSPAGFFSNQGVDNGFTITKDLSGFRVSSGLNAEATPSNNHLNFSLGEHVLPRIDEIGDQNPGSTNSQSNHGKRKYMNFDSSNNFKTLRDNNGIAFSGLSMLDQNGVSVTGLTHHLSLPKTASEMATVEKFLQFQGSPCKIRAKRGCATHPRSIAERVRRTRISERMRKLHDLFPNLDKQTNTADMLELAVEYIKDLQKQVKSLTDTRSKCTCSSLQKPYLNTTA